MKEDFDFDNVGKRMPYKVPSDFFASITESTLAEAERRAKTQEKPVSSWWRALSVAASVAILVGVGIFLYTSRSTNNTVAIVDKVSSEKIPAEDVEQPDLAVTSDLEETSATAIQDNQLKEPEQKVVTPKENLPAQQMAKADKPETLDDVLASLSDEELLRLAAVAEADLDVHEQTLTNEHTL